MNSGFTGHEHAAAVGLINMKGRLYDAVLGRFISADPFVQAPTNTQSFNRYSYVINNPLSYTDPSGYYFDLGYNDNQNNGTYDDLNYGYDGRGGGDNDNHRTSTSLGLGDAYNSFFGSELNYSLPEFTYDNESSFFSLGARAVPDDVPWIGHDMVGFPKPEPAFTDVMIDGVIYVGKEVYRQMDALPVGKLVKGGTMMSMALVTRMVPVAKGGTKVGDLKPINGSGHQKPRPDLQKLSDDELLTAARNPAKGDPIIRNTDAGTLSDGNGRAIELQRRAADPSSKITNDTLVPVIDRTPDASMFWDG